MSVREYNAVAQAALSKRDPESSSNPTTGEQEHQDPQDTIKNLRQSLRRKGEKIEKLEQQLDAEREELAQANADCKCANDHYAEAQKQLAAAVEALKGLAHAIPNDAAEAVITSYDAALAKIGKPWAA